jgi:tRNA (Thr-GGU) A37 N-methylase
MPGWKSARVCRRDAKHRCGTGNYRCYLVHEAERNTLKMHPRDDISVPLTGVFSTRSSDRPNPLGLHRVTVRESLVTEFEIGPMEAIDGTPVTDIKPVPESVES